MSVNVGKELAALQRMAVGQLRTRYAEVFGEPTTVRHKDWLVKRIIWRMQAIAEGDLTDRARRRAAELANDADLRRKAPKSPPASVAGPHSRTGRLQTHGDRRLPPPGSTIKRLYKGQTLDVKVLPTGFEYEGEIYKSLSAVAKQITGSHCNGYLFFGLVQTAGNR